MDQRKENISFIHLKNQRLEAIIGIKEREFAHKDFPGRLFPMIELQEEDGYCL